MQTNHTYRFRLSLVALFGKAIMLVALLSFLLANVGITVYTHVCSIAGTQTSLFFDHGAICADEQHAVLPKSCCVAHDTDHNDTHIESIPCCSTQTAYILLDIDTHIEKTVCQSICVDTFVAIVPSWQMPFLCNSSSVQAGLHPYTNRAIPKFQGRDLQSLHQVYII